MSDLVSNLLVKGTLGVLLAFSAATWAIIVIKALQLRRVTNENQGFVARFSVSALSEAPRADSAVGRVAAAGAGAWREARDAFGRGPGTLEARRDFLGRRLAQQIARERKLVESWLAVLASIGSTAPFIGLFGTVFGIIHALHRISGAGSASLDVVAGPIGEALIATGVGIAVAVPAVLAYNFFVRKLKAFAAELEDFTSSFVNLVIASSFRPEDDEQDTPAPTPGHSASRAGVLTFLSTQEGV